MQDEKLSLINVRHVVLANRGWSMQDENVGHVVFADGYIGSKGCLFGKISGNATTICID